MLPRTEAQRENSIQVFYYCGLNHVSLGATCSETQCHSCAGCSSVMSTLIEAMQRLEQSQTSGSDLSNIF